MKRILNSKHITFDIEEHIHRNIFDKILHKESLKLGIYIWYNENGNILIISARIQGIELYDVSTPTSLNHLSHFTLSEGGGGGGTKSNYVTSFGEIAFFSSNNGVYIVDISNPTNPDNLGRISGTNGLILEDLKTFNDVMAVCAHEDGVRLYDISNPNNPIFLSIIPTDNAWTVGLVVDYIYVGDNSNILVVNITDIDNPIVELTLDTGNAIKDIIIKDNLLYAALGSQGVNIYNISNNSEPVLLDNYNTSTLAHRLSSFEDKLAVCDWDDVEILQWDGINLNLVGHKNTTNRTMGIATKENFIYSAEWASIQVMEYGEVIAPDIDLSSTYFIYPYVENGDSYSIFIDVINNGNEILSISDNYTTNPEFSIINPLDTLEPGESQMVEIEYMASEDNASGSYRIYSNDSDQDEIICQLIGNVDGANLGELAPDFNLEYIANGEGYFQLSNNLDKIIVIAFFAPN